MALLASAGASGYDPPIAVSKSTAAALPMTPLDTTSLRLIFTAPANGTVLVRIKGQVIGATTLPRILLGVLDGATLRGRASPMGGGQGAAATSSIGQEVTYLVTGLTPGNSYTWDAAYGVETTVASTNIKYGGPNDALGADAFGAFNFEVWETKNLIAGTLYDPAVAVTASATALLPMTVLDTSNLRFTFTAPSSGKLFWRLRVSQHGSSTLGQILLGILESTTVVARNAPLQGNPVTALITAAVPWESSGIITGISAGSHTYDAAYAVQVVAGAGGLKWGGPDNNVGNDAFGGVAFELWAA